MEYKLTKSDIEDLTMLTNFSMELFDTYETLYQLELADKKDSKAYKKGIERIKDIISITDNIESRLVSTGEQANAVLNYLYSIGGINVPKRYVYTIAVPVRNKEISILLRMINKVGFSYMEQLPKYPEFYLLPQGLFIINNDPTGEARKIAESQMKFKMTFDAYISVDIVSIELAILEEKIKNAQGFLKNELIRCKYSFAFILKDIEARFLRNGFKIEENPYLINGNAKTIYKVTIEEEKKAKENIIMNSFEILFKELNKYEDNYFLTNSLSVIINEIALRAFLILDDEIALKITQIIEQFLSENEGKSNRTLICGFYRNILKYRNQDKCIPQIVSFCL